MADLGSIGILRNQRYSRIIESWRGVLGNSGVSSTPQLLLSANYGTISGTVDTAGTADYNYTVRLYWRPTGQLLDSALTKTDGSFTFSIPVSKDELSNYQVIAIDQTKTYNALIYDLITPF